MAILNAFDEELHDLEHDLKQKKQEISDVELSLKKAEHGLALLVKEQSGASGIIEGLEKQFTWIKDESRWEYSDRFMTDSESDVSSAI